MTSTNSIKRNTVINLAGAAIPIAVALLTVPLYLKVIGDTRYGVLAIIWVLFGYFALFDFGLGRATTHYIARLKDVESTRENVFWTALFTNATFGVVGGLLLLLIGPTLFTHILKIPTDLYLETIRSLPWLAMAVPVLTLSSVLFSALEGREQFFSMNMLMTGVTVTSQLIPLTYALWHGPDLSSLIATIVITRAAGLALVFTVCLKKLPVRSTLSPDLSTLRTLLGYGGWITVTGIIAPILTTVDQLFIGAVLGARSVTYYSIPYNFANQVSILPMSLARTLFPRFSMLEGMQARNVAQASLLTLAAVFTPIVVFSMGMLKPFLRAWVGPSVADVSAPVGTILLFGIWFNGLAFVPYALVRGQGRPDLTAKFHLLELPLYLAMLWGGLKLWGLSGAAWAWSMRVGLDFFLLFFAAKIPPRRSLVLLPTAAIILVSFLTVSLFTDSLLWEIGAAAALTLVSMGWSYLIAPQILRDAARDFLHAIGAFVLQEKGANT